MRTSTSLRLLAAALLLGAGELSAQTFTITFDGIGGSGTPVPATFGSVANLAITHRARNTFGNGTLNGDVCVWTTGYGDLVNVAYTCNSGAGVGEFTLTPTAGYQVTINSYDIGEYQGRIAGNAETRIYGLDLTQPAVFSATQALTGVGHWTLSPGLTSTAGFNIQWGDNWDYGIDNINLTVSAVSAVPEPATVALMGGGLLALGLGARLRRRGA